MSKTNFTPGPWDVVQNEVQARDQRRTIVCEVTGSLSNPVAMADARLIAAAPEMYRLLEEELEYKRALEKERYGDGAVDPWPEWTELLARIRGEEMS